MSDARRSLLWPSLFTFVAFAILMSLGFWQVERLHWKEALIATLGDRGHAAPIALPPRAEWNRLTPGDEFTRVRLRVVIEPGKDADLAIFDKHPLSNYAKVQKVFIDGERWQTSDSDDRLVVDVEPGPHQIEVRRDGYRTYRTDIDVRPGETRTLNVSLSRQ